MALGDRIIATSGSGGVAGGAVAGETLDWMTLLSENCRMRLLS